MKKIVTIEEKEEWKRRYLLGETARSIAKDYPQYNESTISRNIKKMGISRGNQPFKHAINNENIKNDYLNGMYCEEIAKKYNMEVHTVYTVLDKYGIERKSGIHSSCKEDYFEKIDTPNKAYLLGFITADGSIIGKYFSSCAIEVHNDDRALIEFAKAEINPNATITECITNKKNNCRINFSSKRMCDDLIKYGVVPNKSKIITKVPEELIPDDLLRFYFRGLIDGDGCIHKDGHISIYSGSYDFIASVQQCLIKILNVSHLSIYHGTTWFISWSKKEDKQKFFDFLYKDCLNDTFYYKRKYQRLYDSLYDNT